MDWLSSLIDGLWKRDFRSVRKPLEQRFRLDMGRFSEVDIRGDLRRDRRLFYYDRRDGN